MLFKFSGLMLLCALLAACASSGARYAIPEGSPMANVIVDDNIGMVSTWKSTKSRNLLDGLFKLVDTINAAIPDQRATVYGVDGLSIGEPANHVRVEAGLRELLLEAQISGDYYHGSLSYEFEPGHEYQVRVQVADTARLDDENSKGRFLAELRDMADMNVVLKTAYF